jgi:hypothetical protein
MVKYSKRICTKYTYNYVKYKKQNELNLIYYNWEKIIDLNIKLQSKIYKKIW